MQKNYLGLPDYERIKGYQIDGVAFPVIKRERIPTAITKAPVTWNNVRGNEVHETEMLAGLVGMRLLDDGTRAQPVSGWWVLENK